MPVISMRYTRYAVLAALGILACSNNDSTSSKQWGEVCITEYQGLFSYDVSTPEQSCVELINQYRAELNQPPLARWTDGEACAASEASTDAASNDAHGAFGQCGEMAQNTCPGWGSVDSVLGGCLLGMYCEGPSPSGNWDMNHGHHMNMVSNGYTMVACGFYQMSDGQYWVNMNFK
jgi:uncharacterized protein YkwD